MIKFFRHFRQAMIKENRVSKYLLYAIGEIVLVVIGIMIALQINNWNEQKKVNRELVEVLKEVRSNLIADSLKIYEIHTLKSEDIKTQYKVIDSLENGNIPYDSIEYDLGRVLIARRIVLVDNGYQLMKKFGLERVKDVALRNELIHYYTASIKRIYDDTEDDDYEFITVFLPYVRSHFLDWDYSKFGVPADYEHLKSDQYFLTFLKVNIKNAESTTTALSDGRAKIREILPMLDKTISTYD
jgi:hypothetical protein